MRVEIWAPQASSCAHVLGVLGPYRDLLLPLVTPPQCVGPSYEALRPVAREFEGFSGGRDLFAALTIHTVQGLEGNELVRVVNERLAQDELEHKVAIDRLSGRWLDLWEQAIRTYAGVWPSVEPELQRVFTGLRARLETVRRKLLHEITLVARSRSCLFPSRIMVGIVERGLGMHRASDGVAVLEAYPPDELWPYPLIHELVHAVTPRYRPDSPLHQLAGEILTDLSAAHLGAALSSATDPMLEKDLGTRWEGWKVWYGAETRVSALDAQAQALVVFQDLLERRSFFEDAVDRLAVALGQ